MERSVPGVKKRRPSLAALESFMPATNRLVYEAIKLPEFYPLEEARASLQAVWLTAINERERRRGRRQRNMLPVRKILLPAEPVRTWASWIERTKKDD